MTQAVLEQVWKRRALSLARRLNFAWWLDRFNALLIGGLLLFAVFLLLARTWRPGWLSPTTAGLAFSGTLTVLALAAWWLARKRFVGVEVALTRLDDRLRLHNRLASASARVGPWPKLPADRRDNAGLHWNLARVWLPGFAALLLVAAAWWMPLPEAKPMSARAAEPGAWQQMEDWLGTLEEEGLIEDASIKELESRVEELRNQPEEEWFSHSSLEATDTLRQSLGMEIRDLAAEMDALERQLSALQSFSSQMSEAAKERLAKEFQQALEALEGSGLSLDQALMKQLKEIDPAALGQGTLSQLSAEQLKALQEQLRKGAGALGAMEGLPALGEGSEGGGEGEIAGRFGNGQGDGTGGVSRGRGDAPLFFGDKEQDLGTSNLEGIANDDFSKAAVGEVLGLGETERKIERASEGPVSGGTVGALGQGGEAVSRETLLPDEQTVLKRYFK